MKDNKTTSKVFWTYKRLIVALVVFMIVALVVPVFLSFVMNAEIFSKALGDANGWLGFWGGYLGAIIGAITVAVVTSIQMRVQRELHRETIKEQRELQILSIKETARLNDEQQRDIVVQDITLQKLDTITEHLIEIMGLNITRFNIVRRIVEYNELNTEILNEKIHIFDQRLQLDPEKDKEVIKELVEELNIIRDKNTEYLDLTDDLKEEETTYRLKIMALSAKILSESISIDIEDVIEPFRKKQSEIIDDIHNQILEYDEYLRLLRQQKTINSLATEPTLNYAGINLYSEEFRTQTNDMIRQIKVITRENLSNFLNSTKK